MSNDSITPTNALVNYNPGNVSLLEMRANPERFPRLYTIPREQAVFEMSKIVTQAFLYRGQAADPTNIQFISSTLVQEIIENNPYGAASLSFAEIQVIVKRAIFKGQDEVFNISVASLYKVLADFAKGEGTLNQRKVEEMRRMEEYRQIRDSVIAPMLKAYTGEFLKNNKIK